MLILISLTSLWIDPMFFFIFITCLVITIVLTILSLIKKKIPQLEQLAIVTACSLSLPQLEQLAITTNLVAGQYHSKVSCHCLSSCNVFLTYRNNAALMLARRLRRRPNIKSALV